MPKRMKIKSLGCLIQEYFCRNLIQQRNVSPQTIASYKDTMRIFLKFAQHNLNKPATKLALADIDEVLVIAFLDYLEMKRKNKVRSRNARLAAIRSFMHFAGLQEPCALPASQKISAIPMKRFERPMIGYLHRNEIEAIIKTPNPNTWTGRRDRTLFATLYNTGARVSEIVNVKCMDIENAQCSVLHLHGKGRKQRAVPLWKRTSRTLRQWLPQIDRQPHSPLFPNRFSKPMTRSGVAKQLQSAVTMARKQCPSLEGKKVSPHTIRHTTAMNLLQSEVDISVIAMWLGHESIVTTHQYMQADLEMKKQALQKIKAPKIGAVTYRPPKDVLAFLDSL